MDREEYIAKVFEKNEYCNCEDLVRLSYLEKERKDLSSICNDLFESLLGINKGNGEVRKIYEQKIHKRENFHEEHNLELNSLIKKEKLKLFYHDEKENYKKQQVDYVKGRELLKKNKIITVHCHNCDQQIEAVS